MSAKWKKTLAVFIRWHLTRWLLARNKNDRMIHKPWQQFPEWWWWLPDLVDYILTLTSYFFQNVFYCVSKNRHWKNRRLHQRKVMVLLVCASIFSLTLGLIIGLEDSGSFSYLVRCWLDALMLACWMAGVKEEGAHSLIQTVTETRASRGGENKAWCHQGKIEVWVTNISAHNGWNEYVCVCVCVTVTPSVCVKMWGHVVSLQFYAGLLHVVQHRPPTPHFKAARGSKLYYRKLHHDVKWSPSDSSPHCRLVVSLLKINVGHLYYSGKTNASYLIELSQETLIVLMVVIQYFLFFFFFYIQWNIATQYE